MFCLASVRLRTRGGDNDRGEGERGDALVVAAARFRRKNEKRRKRALSNGSLEEDSDFLSLSFVALSQLLSKILFFRFLPTRPPFVTLVSRIIKWAVAHTTSPSGVAFIACKKVLGRRRNAEAKFYGGRVKSRASEKEKKYFFPLAALETLSFPDQKLFSENFPQEIMSHRKFERE